ncbi:MAG: NosR/NirI family protein [Rhodanobacter sp.]|jgi:NosR/NirI family nitrous oxide reductase transcriptional regulator|nr:NosR/NirI family protein [Rhodanobacter sp.]
MNHARYLARLFVIVACVFMGVDARTTSASTYESPLPEQLDTDPNLCAYVPCNEVIAGADHFAPRTGQPPYAQAVDAGGKTVGYVFLSTDIVDIPAYSGKPIVTLIGMDTHGVITGVKILRHSEPILLLGIPESSLLRFVGQYVGKFVGDRIEVGQAATGEAGTLSVDAISGATVTAIAEHQVILQSGMQVAREVGILPPVVRTQARYADVPPPTDWAALVQEGAVQHLMVRPEELGLPPVDGGKPYVDLHYGALNPPGIGRLLLGDTYYESLMSRLKPGENALFIINDGTASFKGSGFVRGGIYDRVQVRQEGDTFSFRDTDYLNLYSLRVPGAPEYTESAIFIVRSSSFSVAYPWNLVFLANRVDKQTDARTFVSFTHEYWLPARYLQGGRPKIQKPQALWQKIWNVNRIQIALFFFMLIVAATIYSQRDRLVRRADRKHKWPVRGPQYVLWTLSVVAVGFGLMAQPSITQVLTWFHSMIYQWNWELFLSDPFIFIFWWFTIISLLIWGRGLFCGWLCPFGSLSELLHRGAAAIGLARLQFKLPKPVHDKLKWVKYAIFLGLLGVSFFSMSTAEKLAEVEPFKTTFLVGVLQRTWPYGLYVAVLLGLSIFIERPFCKYLCPLGAGLAIPTTFRLFGLKRKQECQTCAACAVGCGSQSIDAQGHIDQRECMLCLDCMILYYDANACPPLSQERKRRNKAGEPLTAIGGDGYFTPVMRKTIPHTLVDAGSADKGGDGEKP